MIISSTIRQIKLPFDLGFCYGKVIDLSAISPMGIIISIYDYVSTKKDNYDLEKLGQAELLFGSKLLFRLPPVKGRNAFPIVSKKDVHEEYIIPDFKFCQDFIKDYKHESQYRNWRVVRDFSEMNEIVSIDKVRHLEHSILHTEEGIICRCVMELCRKNNWEITEYYDISKQPFYSIYWQMQHVPIYSTIPKEIRGKCLP